MVDVGGWHRAKSSVRVVIRGCRVRQKDDPVVAKHRIPRRRHEGGHEPAAICRPCYDHLQERADLMEAALHIDLKEAAQIVYEAVWSDPSDPP